MTAAGPAGAAGEAFRSRDDRGSKTVSGRGGVGAVAVVVVVVVAVEIGMLVGIWGGRVGFGMLVAVRAGAEVRVLRREGMVYWAEERMDWTGCLSARIVVWEALTAGA